NGKVYTAHTIARSSGGQVSAIRFYQISTDGKLDEEVTYGASGSFFFFPATMVDSRGNVVIVFNRSSASQDVGILYTGRKPTDAHNTLQASATLQQGLSYYHLSTRAVQ